MWILIQGLNCQFILGPIGIYQRIHCREDFHLLYLKDKKVVTITSSCGELAHDRIALALLKNTKASFERISPFDKWRVGVSTCTCINIYSIGDCLRNEQFDIISSGSEFFNCQSNKTHHLLFSYTKYCRGDIDTYSGRCNKCFLKWNWTGRVVALCQS